MLHAWVGVPPLYSSSGVYVHASALNTIQVPGELSWFGLTFASEFLMYSQCTNAIDAWRFNVSAG
jgi:hypothetical protein